MATKFVLNADGDPVPEPDLITWATWFETFDQQVALTDIGDTGVSTVFVGIAPILFETMVLGGRLNGRTWRSATRAEAEQQHEAIVAQLRPVGFV